RALFGLRRLTAVANRTFCVDANSFTVGSAHAVQQTRELIRAAIPQTNVVKIERHHRPTGQPGATLDVRDTTFDRRVLELNRIRHVCGEAIAHRGRSSRQVRVKYGNYARSVWNDKTAGRRSRILRVRWTVDIEAR